MKSYKAVRGSVGYRWNVVRGEVLYVNPKGLVRPSKMALSALLAKVKEGMMVEVK
jgi:hypothetical protein